MVSVALARQDNVRKNALFLANNAWLGEGFHIVVEKLNLLLFGPLDCPSSVVRYIYLKTHLPLKGSYTGHGVVVLLGEGVITCNEMEISHLKAFNM